MKTHSLKAFADSHTQAEVANILGCTQPAVSKILLTNREVYITETANGEFDFYEIKRSSKNPVRS